MGSFGEAGEPANSIAKEEAPSFCSQSLQNEGASQEGLLRRDQRVTVKGEVHSLSYVIPLVVREGEGVSLVILADDDTPRLGVERDNQKRLVVTLFPFPRRSCWAVQPEVKRQRPQRIQAEVSVFGRTTGR